MDSVKTFEKIVERMADMQRLYDVPRGAFESVERYFHLGHPAILTFPVIPQDAVEEALELEFGSRLVTVRFGDYSSPKRYIGERREIKMTLRALLDSMPTDDNLYMANQQASFSFLRNVVGKLVDDIGGEQIFELPTVWLGTNGAVTPLHKDSTDNFAFHVAGKKTWTIFSPLDADRLDLNDVNDRPGSEFAVSNIDLRAEDALQTLCEAGVRAITCEVRAGECLYVPAGWSHFVSTDERTLMVNVWQISSFPARILQ